MEMERQNSPSDADTSAIFHSASNNPFGLSDKWFGSMILLFASSVAAVVIIMLEIAEAEGLSSCSLTLYGSFAQLGLSLLLDAYLWYSGSQKGNRGWFVFIDIFRGKQRSKFMSIEHWSMWFGFACILSWVWNVLLVASFVFVADVGDAIALFDGYPILVPFLGLCIPTVHDWKHRYFVCLALIVGGVLLLTQPSFLFGYDFAIDVRRQTIGCILALSSAVANALALIATVMIRKLSLADASEAEQQQAAINEESPLINETEDQNHQIHTAAAKQTSKKEYIIHDELATTVLLLEYAAIANILLCFLFAPLSTIDGSPTTAWFWQEFVLFYPSGSLSAKALNYAVGASILTSIDFGLFIYGIFKVNNAPLASILDISDVFFTYMLSYFWLKEEPNTYGAFGSVLIIISIIFGLIPWTHPTF